MTNWTTDEFGTRTFTHEGWVVQIWRHHGIEARRECRGETCEIEVDEHGIRVRGESRFAGEICPQTVEIPWPVIAAVVEARAIVG